MADLKVIFLLVLCQGVIASSLPLDEDYPLTQRPTDLGTVNPRPASTRRGDLVSRSRQRLRGQALISGDEKHLAQSKVLLGNGNPNQETQTKEGKGLVLVRPHVVMRSQKGRSLHKTPVTLQTNIHKKEHTDKSSRIIEEDWHEPSLLDVVSGESYSPTGFPRSEEVKETLENTHYQNFDVSPSKTKSESILKNGEETVQLRRQNNQEFSDFVTPVKPKQDLIHKQGERIVLRKNHEYALQQPTEPSSLRFGSVLHYSDSKLSQDPFEVGRYGHVVAPANPESDTIRKGGERTVLRRRQKPQRISVQRGKSPDVWRHADDQRPLEDGSFDDFTSTKPQSNSAIENNESTVLWRRQKIRPSLGDAWRQSDAQINQESIDDGTSGAFATPVKPHPDRANESIERTVLRRRQKNHESAIQQSKSSSDDVWQYSDSHSDESLENTKSEPLDAAQLKIEESSPWDWHHDSNPASQDSSMNLQPDHEFQQMNEHPKLTSQTKFISPQSFQPVAQPVQANYQFEQNVDQSWTLVQPQRSPAVQQPIQGAKYAGQPQITEGPDVKSTERTHVQQKNSGLEDWRYSDVRLSLESSTNSKPDFKFQEGTMVEKPEFPTQVNSQPVQANYQFEQNVDQSWSLLQPQSLPAVVQPIQNVNNAAEKTMPTQEISKEHYQRLVASHYPKDLKETVEKPINTADRDMKKVDSRNLATKSTKTTTPWPEQSWSAEAASYQFSTDLQDGIADLSQSRSESRADGVVRGSYSYSDGFVQRTVQYIADRDGYRILGESGRPLSEEGPLPDPEGLASVRTDVEGRHYNYVVHGSDLSRQKGASRLVTAG